MQQTRDGVSEIQHHHHGEIGVSPQSQQHKFVPSPSTQPEGTSKSSLDGDEIKNYINKCFAEKMAELVALISKILAEVVKALKNEANKQSQHEDYDKGSLNDMEVSHDEESSKQHILEEQKLLDVNAADKEAGCEDDFENEDYSDLQALEDVDLTAKEYVNEVNLKSQESTNVTDVQIVRFYLTSLMLRFESFKPQKQKHLPNEKEKKSKVLRSQYISKYGSVSKDAIDFDKEEKLKYAFDGKETDNHYRVNAFGLGYRQLDFIVAYPQFKNWFYLMSERKTYWNDEHLDVIFCHLGNKSKIQLGDNYRYTTISCFFKTYVENTHTRYYPAEPAVELSTQQDYAESIVVAKNEDAIANIIHGFCMPTGLPWYMIDEVYVPINCGKKIYWVLAVIVLKERLIRVYDYVSINCGKIFYWVLAVIVLKERLIRVYDSLSSKRKKEPPIEIQKLTVMLPTYLSYNDFYDKTERTDRPSLEAYKGKITQQTGLANEISFDVDYVQNIPQQASDSLDCGVFVCTYAKILSEGLQVHSCGFDGASQRARYASLLWHYGVKKANEGYTSDNGDPPRLRKSVIEEIDASAIVTLE
ncbi:hypothetical protein CQW23_08058 [Capsicum baccatum]|uniref:Ubiquitin-like protease family profile domain-containing protein n=1 Tax=Capsicum baccatum TaxID=33114 RepID=A0A2G2X7X2_CAPBA|nr:hypothetical protein CQW23_08058 [Capsicum baccatum]